MLRPYLFVRDETDAPWRPAADLAKRQRGVVSRRQLLNVGLTQAAIDHAMATSRLYPIFRGVVAIGHPHLARNAYLRAATLTCGSGSVVSHGTAAHLLGLWEHPPADIDVIAPVEAGRKQPGIRRRHVPLPGPRDSWIYDGVPCTSPSRTIIDCAGSCRGASGERRLRRLVEQAAVGQMLHVPEIKAIRIELAGPARCGGQRVASGASPTTALGSNAEASSSPSQSSISWCRSWAGSARISFSSA